MERRRFLTALIGTVLAVGGLPAIASRARATVSVDTLDLDKVRRYRGSKVILGRSGAWPRRGTLVSVLEQNSGPAGRNYEQFSLNFRIPGGEEGIYRVELDDDLCCELQLLAIGPAESQEFQAVCSRQRGRA